MSRIIRQKSIIEAEPEFIVFNSEMGLARSINISMYNDLNNPDVHVKLQSG